jgi:hypothetical protein
MFTRNDGILIAIAVIVLVIGTAIGSAYVMLGMAVTGLVISAVLYRANFKQRGSVIVLTATVVALAAGIIGFILSVR